VEVDLSANTRIHFNRGKIVLNDDRDSDSDKIEQANYRLVKCISDGSVKSPTELLKGAEWGSDSPCKDFHEISNLNVYKAKSVDQILDETVSLGTEECAGLYALSIGDDSNSTDGLMLYIIKSNAYDKDYERRTGSPTIVIGLTASREEEERATAQAEGNLALAHISSAGISLVGNSIESRRADMRGNDIDPFLHFVWNHLHQGVVNGVGSNSNLKGVTGGFDWVRRLTNERYGASV